MVSLLSHLIPGHRIITDPDISKLRKQYQGVWKDRAIPYRQLEVTKKELPNLEKLPAIVDLIRLIKATRVVNPTVMEIGCSTGYHAVAFKRAGLRATYEGCDYSPEFIKVAKAEHPGIQFKVSDATKLNYKNNQFDIVVSGCCLLHIIDYREAVNEAVRVAKKYVIFHRTPVIHTRKTTFTKKNAYGVEMLEIIFNEGELTDVFAQNNLAVIAAYTHDRLDIAGIGEPVFMKSYLCFKLTRREKSVIYF